MRALLLAALIATAAPALADDRYVDVEHADVVRLPAPAATIIIGNPAIADAVIHDRSTLIVTGKMAGRTNIIALDRRGRVIFADDIVVGSARRGQVIVQRGMDRTTYACGQGCDAVAAVGDDADTFDRVTSQQQTRIQLAQDAVAASEGSDALAGGRDE